MTKEEFFAITEKYFAMSNSETQEYLDKKFKNDYDRKRLVNIIRTVVPYCEKYLDLADEKLKRKVGMVFMSKLDYANFEGENIADTVGRLDELFQQTTDKGINPYKIIYCSVLTEGNVKIEMESRRRYTDFNCNFDNIYSKLKTTLGLTDKECVEIFEKCSTLIAKGNAQRIPEVYNILRNRTAKNIAGEAIFRVFDVKEVVEILKINPSLMTCSTDKIWKAFDYLERKIEPIAAKETKVLYENNAKNKLAHRTIILRKWLKNNSTLLTLNDSTMFDKESYFKNGKNEILSNYKEVFEGFFTNPTTLAIISQIPLNKINKNAISNIGLLESFTSKENVAKYLVENPYVVAMDSTKFMELVEKVFDLSQEKPDEKYMQRFLESGKTLFASNLDFSVDKITEKLVNNAYMIKEDFDALEGMELVNKFAEIFLDGSSKIPLQIEKLIKEKEVRTRAGEKVLRTDIRTIGLAISYLPKILKSDEVSKSRKKEVLLKLCTELDELKEKRFALAGRGADMSLTQSIEIKNNKDIEDVLNIIRDTYEQKRFKIGKKYQDCEILYNKMMDYLSASFDDKEAICEIYQKEIVNGFVDSIKETFETSENMQGMLFTEHLDVKIEDDDIRKSVQKVQKKIEEADFDVETPKLNFTK